MGDKQAYLASPGISTRGGPYNLTGTHIYFAGAATGQPYSESLTFSPDGSNYAYCTHSGISKVAVVVGNKKGQDYDEVGLPVFSPDGNKVGYWARNKREIWWKIVEAR